MVDFIAAAQAKPAWAVSALLALVYTVRFYTKTTEAFEDELMFGFCVWCNNLMPDKDSGCSKCEHNSHIMGTLLQVVALAVAVLFYVKDSSRNDGNRHRVYLGIMFVIFFHGLLHWYLQYENENLPAWLAINCHLPKSEITLSVRIAGYTGYSVICYMIPRVILTIAVGDNKGGVPVHRLSLLFAAAVFALTFVKGIETVLPSLFVVTRPLTCAAGLLSDEPTFDNDVLAHLFSLSTVAGIFELAACPKFLEEWGGHVWYDLTLPLAQLAALPYFNDYVRMFFGRSKKKEP